MLTLVYDVADAATFQEIPKIRRQIITGAGQEVIIVRPPHKKFKIYRLW